MPEFDQVVIVGTVTARKPPGTTLGDKDFGGTVDVGALAVRHETASAGLVRRAIAADLARQDIAADAAADVILVASELVGNAVIHALSSDAGLAVSWEVGPRDVTVEVGDAGVDEPQVRHSDTSSTGGRGLAIVAALAEDWGTRRTSFGKQVWARVPVTRSA